MPNQYVEGPEAEERFWLKVNKQGPKRKRMETRCWTWQAGCLKSGYGHFWMEGKTYKAHRAAWYFTFGKWPSEDLHHKCKRRECVRPSHLSEVKDKEHNDLHKKEFCKRNHPLSGENVWINPAGARVCLTCKRMHGRENERKRRERMGDAYKEYERNRYPRRKAQRASANG